MASELELEMHRLNNQARFVQMIVNKELVVSNRKKADIVAELRKLDFRPFSKVSKAKKAGETEELVEIDDEENEDEDEGKDTDYDYLLGMAIWSLTKEKVSVAVMTRAPFLTIEPPDRQTPCTSEGEGAGATGLPRSHSDRSVAEGPRTVPR